MTKRTDASEAGGQPADPFEVWRKFYEANEQIWSRAAKDTTNTEAFAQAQAKMLETFLAFQRTARDSMNAQLASLNLPSRDDVARLGEIVLGLEEKIDRLEDRLADLSPRSGAKATKARARGRTSKAGARKRRA